MTKAGKIKQMKNSGAKYLVQSYWDNQPLVQSDHKKLEHCDHNDNHMHTKIVPQFKI